jgi:hypothetical protein
MADYRLTALLGREVLRDLYAVRDALRSRAHTGWFP